ncbi:hypothetical protein ACWDR5_19480 [Streptomyces koyangensis]
MAQFKAGDKVRWGAQAGVVRFGPYIGVTGTPNRYMVERADNGRCEMADGSALSLALEVGDRVTVDGLPGTFALAAGPWRFPREGSGPQYVVTDDEGNAYVEPSSLVRAMVTLEADGSHVWRDREGDIWYPLGEADGEQRYGTERGAVPTKYYSTLEELRTDWGPLERVAPEADKPRAWRDRSGDIWYPLGVVGGVQRYGMDADDEPDVYCNTLAETRETWGPLTPVPDEPTATAVDAAGDTWYRHGADADGVGRWSMSQPGQESRSLGLLSTWLRVVSAHGPMRGAA